MVRHSAGLQSTVSVLQLLGLAREDDGAVLRCLAHSQASHTPLVARTQLDLIRKWDPIYLCPVLIQNMYMLEKIFVSSMFKHQHPLWC